MLWTKLEPGELSQNYREISYTCVGWTLAMTKQRCQNMWPGPFHDADPLISLNKPYLPGSSSGHVQDEDVKQRRWHHVGQFRTHWAQYDWLCRRLHAHSKVTSVGSEVGRMDYWPTTCQPSLKNFGITSSNTVGSIRIKPFVEGWSW